MYVGGANPFISLYPFIFMRSMTNVVYLSFDQSDKTNHFFTTFFVTNYIAHVVADRLWQNSGFVPLVLFEDYP